LESVTTASIWTSPVVTLKTGAGFDISGAEGSCAIRFAQQSVISRR
jgi:hypothetical protein